MIAIEKDVDGLTHDAVHAVRADEVSSAKDFFTFCRCRDSICVLFDARDAAIPFDAAAELRQPLLQNALGFCLRDRERERV